MSSAYDELSPRARWFMENFDDLGRAEMIASYEAQVARIKQLHEPYRSVYDTDGNSCSHCNRISGYAVPFPCDTIKALEGST